MLGQALNGPLCIMVQGRWASNSEGENAEGKPTPRSETETRWKIGNGLVISGLKVQFPKIF